MLAQIIYIYIYNIVVARHIMASKMEFVND